MSKSQPTSRYQYYPVTATHKRLGTSIPKGKVIATDEASAMAMAVEQWNQYNCWSLAIGEPSPLPEYQVLAWGSFPAGKNDDCWTGSDFCTQEEAQRFLQRVRSGDPGLSSFRNSDVACVVLHRTAVGQWLGRPCLQTNQAVETWNNPSYRADESSVDELWRSEQAHQAGMGMGCAGYNDVMGY